MTHVPASASVSPDWVIASRTVSEPLADVRTGGLVRWSLVVDRSPFGEDGTGGASRVKEAYVAKDAVEFLRELGRRGHEPLWGRVRGRARLELVEAHRVDRWLIAIDGGDVAVSHKGGAADCTIRGDSALFDRLCRGEENAVAAVLRGALACTGEVELLYAIQRVFPGPSSAGPVGGARA